MDWSTILSKVPDAFPALLGALVGGCIALLAAAVAQYLSHRFTQRREAEKFLREKAEELLNALDQFSDWVIASSQANHPTPSPLKRASVLQVLYFPQLAPHFETMRQAAIQVFPLQARLKGQPADLKWMGLQPLSIQEREEAKQELTRRLLAYHETVDSVTEAILAMPQWKARRLHSP